MYLFHTGVHRDLRNQADPFQATLTSQFANALRGRSASQLFGNALTLMSTEFSLRSPDFCAVSPILSQSL
uniref:Uncharacterized protein n=1 Tax=Onchocerca volvulus TaxID=6282 RepID=A0A8R1Y5V5_ONCVO